MRGGLISGLLVLVTSGALGGGFNAAGLIFLALVFLPIVLAYRRDRLSFPILFGSLFLPMWPWAMYKALSRAGPTKPTPTGQWQPAAALSQPAGPPTNAPHPHTVARWLCGFLAFVLGGLGLIFVSVAPGAGAGVAAAQTLAARGVQVPLGTAQFTTEIVRALRATGSDGCQLSAVTVTYVVNGTQQTARLPPRYIKSHLLPTCAEARSVAADDYPSGTVLLVDPQDPAVVGVAAGVPAVAKDTAYAGQLRSVGETLLGLAGVSGLALVLLLRRRPHAAPPRRAA